MVFVKKIKKLKVARMLHRLKIEYHQIIKPSKKAWFKSTVFVFVAAVLVSIIIGGIDIGFSEVIRLIQF